MSIGNLTKALQGFQSQCPVVPFDQEVEYFDNKTQKAGKFKFCSLPHLIRFTQPYLHAWGLAVIQPLLDDGVQTILMHESGEYVSVKATQILPPKVQSNIQLQVGATTTLRRKAYAAILGIAADDDNGENEATPQDNPDTTQESSNEIVGAAERAIKKRGGKVANAKNPADA
jgi:hypothetical protein